MAVNLEAIRRRVQELQNGRRNSSVQQWKPKEPGEYYVRGLPWPEKFLNPGQPLVERWFYYIGDSYGLLAPNQFKKPDPINEFISELYKSGKPDDRLMAKKLRAKMMAYMPIVVKKGKDADPERVVVWSLNKILYQKMLGWFLDEDIGDYLDPESGYDIKVVITDSGKKFNNRTVLNYDVELTRKSSKLANSPDETKKLLDAIPNIDDMHELKSYEELEKILQKWLEGGDSSSDQSDGSERGNAGADALDELANDLKSGDEKKIVEDKSSVQEEKKKAPSKKKKDADEPQVQNQSLDDAFNELMAGED